MLAVVRSTSENGGTGTRVAVLWLAAASVCCGCERNEEVRVEPSSGSVPYERVDRGRVEYSLLLLAAGRAMRRYKALHGRFATTWYELGREGFSAAVGPYRVGQPNTVPTEADTHTWRPLRARFRYRIVSSSVDEFHLQALADDDRAVFELRHDMDAPVDCVTGRPWQWGDKEHSPAAAD